MRSCARPPPIQADSTPIMAFVSNLKLTHISLSGFHPEILFYASKTSGATIRKVRFHIRECAFEIREIDGTPHTTLLLSAAQLEALQFTCPGLEWLGLDVSELPHPPLVDSPIFATLASIRSLRHIRLFTHLEPNMRRSMSTKQAMSIFTLLRTRKQGNPLQSLVICADQGGGAGVWVMSELGLCIASLEYYPSLNGCSIKEV